MLKGHVFKEQRFGNQIFALFINTFLAGHNGIVGDYKNSMALSYSGNNVTIGTGAICIQGRFLEEDSSTTLDAGTNTLFCKLVIEIDLDKDNTKTEFNQGKYKILVGETAYPTLTQNNIVKNNSGVYQYELARFKTGLSGISNFVDKRTFLDFDSIYAEIDKKIEEIEDGSIYVKKSGSTLTGTLISRLIIPSRDRTYDLGSAGALWRYIYATQLILPYTKLYEMNTTSIIGVYEQLSARAVANHEVWRPMSASAFNVNSSKRYKKNIREMTEEEANKLDKLKAKVFDYKIEENGTNVAGFIAEDVYKIFPEVVTLSKVDGKLVPDSIDYSKLVTPLIMKQQMLEKRIAELENKE